MRTLILMLTAGLAASAAQAYDEFGYFTGAYATPGAGGCWGAVAQGVNPYGGCTTGNLPPLIHSQADLLDFYQAGTYSHATADLSRAMLSGSISYPNNQPNGAQGTANLKDRLTVVGNLPTPLNVEVDVKINSSILATPDSFNGQLQLNLQLADGAVWTYTRAPNCFWQQLGGQACETSLGDRSFTLTKWVTVDNQNRSFNLAAVLQTIGSNTPVSGVAYVSVVLPQGLSFTSASGVFGTVPAVPEPATWALWLSGIGAVFSLSRRRSPAPRR